MTKEQQLQWEARMGRLAGISAILAVLCIIAATVFLQIAIGTRPDTADESLRVIDRETTPFIASGVIQGIGMLLLIPVLLYLYRVTRFRRRQLMRAAAVLAVAGPLIAAIVGVLRQIELANVAHDFVASSPNFGTKAAENAAEDAFKDSSLLRTISFAGLAGNLALGFSVVLISLNAMRAGITSRFVGVIGIIVGVLYVIPVPGVPQIVQLFLLVAYAALFLNKWPGGRGPAWETGEEMPWPSAAEVAQRRQELGLGSPNDDEGAAPEQSGRSSRKRKRKRR